MFNIESINKKIVFFKSKISKFLSKRKYESALATISLCARLMYSVNQVFTDIDLENALLEISENIVFDNHIIGTHESENTVLFYDGFGLDHRGLAQIYLTALTKYTRVIYVTKSSAKDKIPNISNLVKNAGGQLIFLDEHFYLDKIKNLNAVIRAYSPSKIFIYTLPDDVVAPVVFKKYEKSILRYQINLTDHAFWLGVNSFDFCIEFRNYGASISHKYRNVELNKLMVLPFYPMIGRTEFQGYPFPNEFEEREFIFSGGALYKTLGDGNKYYSIVRHLLNQYEQLLFWYAGSGDDSEIKKLIKDFPNRVYHTQERADLFEILLRCKFYLSTYPISGGLMFQYAARAGKVPFTLKYDETSDDFLLDQKNIGVEYSSESELYAAIDAFMNGSRQQSLRIENSVVDSSIFEKQISCILQDRSTEYAIRLYDVDIEKLRVTYLQRLKKIDVYAIYRNRSFFKSELKTFPLKTIFACVYTQLKK